MCTTDSYETTSGACSHGKLFYARGRHLLPGAWKYEVGPLLQRCEAAVALGNYIWGGTQLLWLAVACSTCA